MRRSTHPADRRSSVKVGAASLATSNLKSADQKFTETEAEEIPLSDRTAAQVSVPHPCTAPVPRRDANRAKCPRENTCRACDLSRQQHRRLQAWFPRVPLHAAAGDGRRLLPTSCSRGKTVPTLESSAADLIYYFPALCLSHRHLYQQSKQQLKVLI